MNVFTVVEASGWSTLNEVSIRLDRLCDMKRFNKLLLSLFLFSFVDKVVALQQETEHFHFTLGPLPTSNPSKQINGRCLDV